MKLGAIITYCSYHNAFIKQCIEEAQKVSDCVVVTSHSHFYDGEKDVELLTDLPLRENDIQLVTEYVPGNPSRYYHNEVRKLGFEAMQNKLPDFDAVFFIDADEVINGDLMQRWLEEEYEQGEDYKFAHFWYYRDTCYRANQVEEGARLVSRETMIKPNIEWWSEGEVHAYSDHWRRMVGYKNQVLGHHYSWAGTKEMLLKKVKTWGHNNDMDWTAMVNEEFTHDFRNCPFRPQYTFTKIEPYVGFTFSE